MNDDAKRKRTEEIKAAAEKASGRLNEKLDAWKKDYEEADSERRQEMSGFNRVVIMGRLTRDPRVRQIPSGVSVADLGLAVNEYYKDKNGEYAERACFVDVVAWGKTAELCGERLKKGAPVLLEGRLQLDQWETSDGQKRSKHKVTADRVQFLDGNKNGGNGQADGSAGERKERLVEAAADAAAVSAAAGQDNIPF